MQTPSCVTLPTKIQEYLRHRNAWRSWTTSFPIDFSITSKTSMASKNRQFWRPLPFWRSGCWHVPVLYRHRPNGSLSLNIGQQLWNLLVLKWRNSKFRRVWPKRLPCLWPAGSGSTAIWKYREPAPREAKCGRYGGCATGSCPKPIPVALDMLLWCFQVHRQPGTLRKRSLADANYYVTGCPPGSPTASCAKMVERWTSLRRCYRII